MGIGQVSYMDIVADTGTIAGFIIITKNSDLWSLPCAASNTSGIRCV